ncbi:glucosidase II beta subunit-like protein-domain-containing protein [Dactylonectria estremocensis]|uniref:Glucosidase 2 subunit beta n=1 Tax=Dactylonectria estremocensis TaxID=1079267 RepID=A0A9P9FBJ1_9HYPO|nr:glucosidase II beta subunit-like protein-domain-containing protein [Dactylonectria estremocensis]
MQQPPSWALLSAIYAFSLAAAGSLPRGVGPEFAVHYQDKQEFSCITNAAIKLSLSQINDNSCDCPDGSDEPGTAACAILDALSPEQPLPGSVSGTTNTANALPGFWCANEGHVGMYVPFLYVNDGTCDYDLCCDGSEEFGGVGGVKCENRCAAIGKEYRRLEDEKRRNMEKAAKKRDAMTAEAQELRRKVELKINTLQDEIRALETKRAGLEQRFREVEQQEKGKVVRGDGGGGKLSVLVGLAKTRVKELRTALEDVLDQRDELQERATELEEILKKFKEEYNPNFNDEGVKAAVKSFEDYSARQDIENSRRVQRPDDDIISVLKEDTETNGVNWKEFEGVEGDDTDILFNLESYLPDFARNALHSALGGIRVWLIENGVLADNVKPGAESTLVKAAREAFEHSEKDLKKKNKSLDAEKEDLSKDYGPGDIFRALKGKCVSTEAGEYTYELCWLEKTAQKSKKGHGNTNMGNFKSVDRAMADDEERLDGKSLGKGERLVLRYEDGQGCWNGPKRRTDVWLGCAETEELWRVAEAEKCVYKMEVGTPAACEGGALYKAAGAKDEL